jgi:hypothetical protein
MLMRHGRLFRLGAALAVIGLSFVVLPPYRTYCEGDQANNYYCAAYEVIVALGSWVDLHSGAVTAIATVVIGAFTIVLARVTNRQARLTRESIDLARDEFVSTHRPKMVLKHIWKCDVNGSVDPQIRAGHPLHFKLDIRNIGSGSGWIRQGNFLIQILATRSRLPQRPPYNEDGIPKWQANLELVRGVTLPVQVSDPARPSLTEDQIESLRIKETRLYCIGTIEYWDRAGTPRQTAFCRYLTFATYPPGPRDFGRFEKFEDSDYEYQD